MVYLYTDQPVVRPAHPVLFRGIVRNQNDTTFAVPAGQPVKVTITDAQGKEVYNKMLTLNGFGAFNDKYLPPQDAAIGQYNITTEYQAQDYSFSFSVSDFRPLEFLVSTKAQAAEVVAGDTISVDVNSTFFSGGPVSGAQVTWTAFANQGYTSTTQAMATTTSTTPPTANTSTTGRLARGRVPDAIRTLPMPRHRRWHTQRSDDGDDSNDGDEQVQTESLQWHATAPARGGCDRALRRNMGRTQTPGNAMSRRSAGPRARRILQ